MNKQNLLVFIILLSCVTLTGCQQSARTPKSLQTIRVLAVEPFLADITQNVAGDRFKIESLVPIGLDPHAFEPTPQDVAKIANSEILIINGAGLETWLKPTLENAGGSRTVIVTSKGLTSRIPHPGEVADSTVATETDPHFWLDPTRVITYVENIRDGFIIADPSGESTYRQNTETYILSLKELDAWIAQQVVQIPSQKRLLVTNHESLGYFADRYDFKIVGTIIPSVNTDASPSAKQLAALIQQIRSSGAVAIFLESDANPLLAKQIAAETGVKVITDLYTHSITPKNGEAPTYITMMKADTMKIVSALK